AAAQAPSPLRPRNHAHHRRPAEPGFAPPEAAFGIRGPASAGLAVAAWRLWNAEPGPDRARALAHWFTGGGLDSPWFWLGFERRRRGALAIESLATVANAAAGAAAARHVDVTAAALSLPDLAWIAFAGLLSEKLWRGNAARAGDQASA
uniref:tryptophan-rich sensory protein n=1 Tax=Falsiroseomonas oryziterrae TaxID=2911368 RepID=UPI001F3F12A4